MRHERCGISRCVNGEVDGLPCPSCYSLFNMDSGAGLVNAADMTDPNDAKGRTYRQRNSDLKHGIPVGTLVEVIAEDYSMTGTRLFVVYHGRDCDQTPLYWLSDDRDDLPREDEETNPLARFMHKWHGGWGEDSLRVVKLP